MNANQKIFLLTAIFLSALSSNSVAQQSGEWVQENWQRVSGAVDDFSTQFPKPDNNTSPQPTQFDTQVQPAEFQSELNNLATQGMSSLEVVDAEQGNAPIDWAKKIQNNFQTVQWPKVLSSLAIVLGGYFGFVWLMGRFNPKMKSGLPSEVFELVGTTRLNTKQNLQLVRLGSKLLLLVSGEEGTQPIAEITDPAEVEYLAGLCNGQTRLPSIATPKNSGATSATVFRKALDRARDEGSSAEAALDKVIGRLTELAGKSRRTDYEA